MAEVKSKVSKSEQEDAGTRSFRKIIIIFAVVEALVMLVAAYYKISY